MAKPKFTPEQIVWALEKSGGNMAAAGRELGCANSTIRRYVQESFYLRLELERIKADKSLTSSVDMKFTPDRVIEAIIKAEGNLTIAARSLNCSRTTVHSYVNKFEAVRVAYAEADNIALDITENELMKNVRAGNVAAQIFTLKTKGRHRGWIEPQHESDREFEEEPLSISLPADSIAAPFFEPYRIIREDRFQEIVLKGGRGSTKSSFASLVMIELLVNNPLFHALAARQVANTLRDSVFSQLRWAIGHLGLESKFKCTLSPLEITYLPTDQKIYFRGADDPLKIKSIKPKFGHIGILWFEELDQFKGDSAVRSIVQSAIRGGENAVIIKSYNPPRSKNNWVNKEVEIPKANRYVHTSNYLDVPKEWLGKIFLSEAKHLKKVNPSAYDHEYGGLAVGTGGLVFENVLIEEITDEDIEQFDRVLHGLDWGYFPDPAHYTKVHYDKARLTLYIYGEVRKWKHSNKRFYDAILKEQGLISSDTIICDSAEPKSVADFREYGSKGGGPKSRGAEKGPESVRYSMKWLQSLAKIVIDPARAPYAMEEFLNYEHEIDKDGNYISDYPDAFNDAIDATRYATNKIWMRRGQ